MDVVIEGKINNDEAMDEVVRSVIELKNIPNAILRITCHDSDVQGRVGFAYGGYIVGGKVNVSGETGYAAIRKLLMIKNGNYAILDPGKQHVPEVNQTLWLKAEKVIDAFPELPATPESLLDGTQVASKQVNAPLDLKAAQEAEAKPLTSDPASASRKYFVDRQARQMFGYFVYVMVALVIAYFASENWTTIKSSLAGIMPH